MLPYWLLFGYFALGSLVSDTRTGPSIPFRSVGFTIGCVAIAIMIGFRWEVGVDWAAYLRTFDGMYLRNFDEVLAMKDPGYMAVNWAVKSLGGPFWLINLIGAAIFVRGLYAFARTQPEPWLAAVIAIPYLVVVVAMNHNRQAIALGFLLIGLTELLQGRSNTRFLAWVLLASLFHASAVLVLPLTVFGVHGRDRLMQLALVPAIGWYLYNFTLQDDVERYINTYVNSAMNSEGAAVRLALCAVPAVLFFLFRSRLRLMADDPLWRNFALAAIGLTILYFYFPSSTAIDRAALYLMPLQMVVFSRMPLIIEHWTAGRGAVIMLSSAILFVWLNYAAYAHRWIPYKMLVPFVGL